MKKKRKKKLMYVGEIKKKMTQIQSLNNTKHSKWIYKKIEEHVKQKRDCIIA